MSKERLIVLALAFVSFEFLLAGSALGQESPAEYTPNVNYTLETGIGREGMYFVGVGGQIDGVTNPDLHVPDNAIVQITIINGDGALHDIVVPDFNAGSDQIAGVGASSVLVFRANESGNFEYICSVPGHRAAGMSGRLIIGEEQPEQELSDVPSIVREPTDLPPPIGDRAPRQLSITMESIELEGQLADGTSYQYWTFDGEVPGPFLRVKQGDTVDFTFRNADSSNMIHSVDFHAVTGPGGGAASLQVLPGDEKKITFQALKAGLYVYHCATPMVAHHITNGMYGLILVEPPGGLPAVDHEFYVMQGEIYTFEDFGKQGYQEFDVRKLLAEQAEYVVFNGAVGALTTQHPLRASVGDTVRIYFGVGGPNYTSSFHVIGEMFDKVYQYGALNSPPIGVVQTITVPPGGASIVDFELEVPGRYILVDHALSRLERGLAGFLEVDGEENPEVYSDND